MPVDPSIVQKIAKGTGFREDVVEQILYLKAVLKMINEDPALTAHFILIGGTAINLFDEEIPRLSVDIDLDYLHGARRRFTHDLIEQHLLTFRRIAGHLGMQCFDNRKDGEKSLELLRLMFQYDSNFLPEAGTVKLDISYLMKDTIYEPARQEMMQLHPDDEFKGLRFLVADPCELWAGKAIALVYKSAQDPKPADVARLYSMQIARHLFDVSKFQHQLDQRRKTINHKRLRAAFILKGVIRIKELFMMSGDGIRNCRDREIRIELDPYLRQDEDGRLVRLSLERMKRLSKEFLHRVCSNSWTKAEKKFVEEFQEKRQYNPEFLFKKGTPEYKRLSSNEYLQENSTLAQE